jgi:aminopeptidase N
MLVTYPVVEDIPRLLSTNTYQKGGWFLHMLRNETGDKDFFKGLRKYYHTFRDGTASTDDLKKVMEKASGKDLGRFFRQWLYRPQIPVIKGSWSYSDDKKQLTVTIEQTQVPLFDIPVQIGIMTGANLIKETIKLNGKSKTVTFTLEQKPDKIVLDPDVCLLYEGAEVLNEE